MTWTVVENQSNTPIQDAFIEIKNLWNKQILWVKTNSSWVFDIKLSANTNFELIVKKPWYEISNIFTGNISWNKSFGNIYLNPIWSTISVSWTLTGNWSLLSEEKVFVSLQWIWIDWNGNQIETSKWIWQEITTSTWGAFLFSWVPANFGSWKLIIAIDWYETKEDSVRNFVSNLNIWTITLTTKQLTQPKVMPITPSQGWVINDLLSKIKLILPAAALGNWTNPWQVIVKETTSIPKVAWTNIIWWKAKEIKATDSNWNPITNLSFDATIELVYSGSEFYNVNSWITLYEIKNLQISYYDATSMAWISLPTIVTSSSWTLFDNFSWATLLGSISWYENITFTLKASTDHFTLFTSLISSVVKNSSTTTTTNTTNNNKYSWGGWSSYYSIISWITNTANSINKYLGSVNQSITLITWKSLNNVLTITRWWKVINLKFILNNFKNNISNITKNMVTFAVWDILRTSKNWSVSISLDGYTKINMQPWSILKIAEVSKKLLTYQHLEWNVRYDFIKKTDWFTYKIKWKTSYATIRWTILEVNSTSTKDEYKLIEWKIDIYNEKNKKTISMVAWDKYIAYTDGKEEIIKWTNTNNSNTSNSTNTDTFTSNTSSNEDIYNITIKLKDKWITKLDPEKTSYYTPISRRELSLLLWRYAEKIFNKSQINTNCVFADLNEIGLDIKKEILKSCQLWLFKWYKWNFLPKAISTRWQVIMVLARLLNENPNMELDDSYDYMLENWIIKVDDRKEWRTAIRYEIYLIMYRIILKYGKL